MIYYVLDSAGKEPACQCRRCKRYGSRRSPGKGNGNPLQYSCLGNPMDKGTWWATVHGVAESLTRPSDKNNNKDTPLRTLYVLTISESSQYHPSLVISLYTFYFLNIFLILFFNFTILYWFCHISK